MAVKYYKNQVPGAEDGTADILATLQQQSQLQNTAGLVELLSGLGNLQGGGGGGTSYQMPPVGDIMAEQRQRAQLQAESLHPDAQYAPGMNPGGVADIMSAFIGALGIPGMAAPQLEGAYRLATRAPLSQIGAGTPEEALDFAKIVASSAVPYASGGGGSPANPYAEVIGTLVQDLIKNFNNQSTGANKTADPNAGLATGQVDPAIFNSAQASSSGTSGDPAIDTIINGALDRLRDNRGSGSDAGSRFFPAQAQSSGAKFFPQQSNQFFGGR